MKTGENKHIIIGENAMLNKALLKRLFRATIMPDSFLPPKFVGPDTQVYFTGGYPFGSQAVRERPADICSALTRSYLDLIDACHYAGVKKMVCLLSSCIYPSSFEPLREDAVLGIMDPVSQAAALPRLLALRLCQYYRRQFGNNFVAAIPATIYGPGDDFSQDGHALPMLMRLFHELKGQQKEGILCRGSGNVRREWIYVDDVAEAMVFIMEHYDDPEPINIGAGEDFTMEELVKFLQEVVGTHFNVQWDLTPSGVDRKWLWNGKLYKMGWKPQVSFRNGLWGTYEWFKTTASAAGQPQRQD